MQLHTYHSLDFVRKLKMFKITAYIHLYYKIPFLSGIACILVTFSFFFDNSQRVLFQYYFSVFDIRQLPCVMGSAMDKRYITKTLLECRRLGTYLLPPPPSPHPRKKKVKSRSSEVHFPTQSGFLWLPIVIIFFMKNRVKKTYISYLIFLFPSNVSCIN